MIIRVLVYHRGAALYRLKRIRLSCRMQQYCVLSLRLFVARLALFLLYLHNIVTFPVTVHDWFDANVNLEPFAERSFLCLIFLVDSVARTVLFVMIGSSSYF